MFFKIKLFIMDTNRLALNNTNYLYNADYLYDKMRYFFNTQLITSAVDFNLFDILNNNNLSIEQIMNKLNTDNKKIEFLLLGLAHFRLVSKTNNVYSIEKGKELLTNTPLNKFVKSISSTKNNKKITVYDQWSNFYLDLGVLNEDNIRKKYWLLWEINSPNKSDLYKTIIGFTYVQILYATIKHNLLNKSKHTSNLSNQTKIPYNVLKQILLVLEDLSIVKLNNNSIHVLERGHMLNNDHQFTLSNICDFMACETYKTWRNINYFFMNGVPSFFLKHNNMKISEYLGCNKERSIVFCNFLGERAKWLSGLIESYPFSKKIIDLGGSDGKILRQIVDADKNKLIEKATLFELPQIVNNIKNNYKIKTENEKRNIFYECGSFLNNDIPKGYDFYFMSRVVQDWTNEKMKIIFKNIYNAMNKNSKLVILDYVYSSNPSKYDINAVLDLACISPCGTMRNMCEINELFEKNNFRLVDVVENEISEYKPKIFTLERK